MEWSLSRYYTVCAAHRVHIYKEWPYTYSASTERIDSSKPLVVARGERGRNCFWLSLAYNMQTHVSGAGLLYGSYRDGSCVTDRENQTSVSSINFRLYIRSSIYLILSFSISLYREMNQDSLDSISFHTLTTPPYSTEVFNAVYHQLCTIV